jgi:hypothetical protein
VKDEILLSPEYATHHFPRNPARPWMAMPDMQGRHVKNLRCGVNENALKSLVSFLRLEF